MLLYDEIKRTLDSQLPEVEALYAALNIEHEQKRLEELELTSASPEFYSGTQDQNVLFAQMGALKDKLESYHKLTSEYEDAKTMLELCSEAPDDAELLAEADECVNAVCKAVHELRLITLLSGQYDKNNAILSFHAGAGGTEAQDWVEMLYRMYTRFCTARGFEIKVMDYLDGDEAGIKSVSILVQGANAYGFLRSENGVHRLVRISPFDSSGRRHTSFASLEVMPELEADVAVDIRPEDIKMEVFRSSGAGGQHINKTSSAVRLIHIPTGIVVSCQNERSQFQNRDMCMKMLAAKLFTIKEREHLDKISDIKGVQKDIAWGSQIRSYVFMPYTLVKDHRTGYENGNINAVMDGDLDGFIDAYLIAANNKTLSDSAPMD